MNCTLNRERTLLMRSFKAKLMCHITYTTLSGKTQVLPANTEVDVFVMSSGRRWFDFDGEEGVISEDALLIKGIDNYIEVYAKELLQLSTS